MSTDRHTITVSDLDVEVVRKEIKNLHLGVYPPAGRVRIAVPDHVNDEAVRLAIVDKLPWIHRQRRAFAEQARQSDREMVNGESHFVFGHRYRLRVIEVNAPPTVTIRGKTNLLLQVRPSSSGQKRAEILNHWYRQQLRLRLPDLIAHWEPIIGVVVANWGIKRMKTRWGTCNIGARRIWINLELAKKPPQCLEYIVVHEMVHLLERHHNDRFRQLMGGFFPQWEQARATLKQAPLGHEDWQY